MKKTTCLMVLLMAVAFTPQVSLGALSRAVPELGTQEQEGPIVLARSEERQAEKDAKKAAQRAAKEAKRQAKLEKKCARNPDHHRCRGVSD